MIALLCAMVALPLATASASVPSAKTAVKLPPGVGTPTPGSGMYTQAALDNPRCSVDKDQYPFGRFDGAVVGGGGVCVRPFKAGEDNGGATSPGVTKDKITIVAVFNKDPVTSSPPKKLVTGANGTMWDAYHDLLVATAPLYETWGRQLDIKYYYSTGNDEAAQRADAVAIKAMKPFAVVNTYNVGLGVMATDLAKAKILVYDAETSKQDFEALAPYLWGSTDPEVAVANSAEVLGKQLVGKKAEYGGDDVKSQTRKFGLVSRDNEIDVAGFKSAFAKYKGTVSSEASYPPTGGTYGDATTAGQAAPTIVSKMKADGVTTVVLFSDAAMNKAMMEQASSQNWFPEWFHTGNSYADYYAFAQSMPADQRAHFFGISGSSPYFTPATDPETATKGPAGSVEDWYWGLQQLHVAVLGRQQRRLAVAGHPRGRPRSDPEDVPAGRVRDAGHRRVGQRHPGRGDGRARSNDGPPVRRVQPGAGGLPADVDEQHRGDRRNRAEGHADGVLREGPHLGRGGALPGGRLADQEGRVVRPVQVGRPLRHRARDVGRSTRRISRGPHARGAPRPARRRRHRTRRAPTGSCCRSRRPRRADEDASPGLGSQRAVDLGTGHVLPGRVASRPPDPALHVRGSSPGEQAALR